MCLACEIMYVNEIEDRRDRNISCLFTTAKEAKIGPFICNWPKFRYV